ncbi:MAG: response regulator [Cytophagales bacterium]|nr:response regulator [Cytophagales bacterium]
MKLLTTQWRRFSHIGVRDTTNYLANKRIVLCNQFSLVVILNTCFYAGAFVASGVYSLLPVQIFFVSLLGMVFYCNQRGHLAAAKNLFLIATAGVIFFVSLLLSREAGAYLYYFPLGGAVFTLFDYRELKKAVGTLVLLLLLVILLRLPASYPPALRIALPVALQEALFLGCFLISMIISMLCVFKLVEANHRAETQLQKAVRKEEELNQELQTREEELQASLEHLYNLSRKVDGEKAKLSAIVESADHLIWSVDTGYRLIHCNSNYSRACQVRFGREPHPGEVILDLMPPPMAALWKPWYDRALTGEKFSVENSGKTYYWEIFFTPIAGDHGQPTGVSVFMQNITARKEAERQMREAKEAAERASHAKAQFLSTMSHEIRTPMNGVIAMAHLLLEGQPRPDQLELLNMLQFSSQGLLSLINDILDLQKIEAGKVLLEEIEFSPEALLRNILYAHRVKAHEKGVGLDCQLAEGLPRTLRGDPVRLMQILNNLVGNAVKFTDRGMVTLAVRPVAETSQGTTLHFSVTDTGIGIAADKLRLIFMAFEQADADTTRKYGGTGLGLAITKRLLEMQGSQIEVESTPGVGSTFHFSLALKKAASDALPTRPEDIVLTGDLGHISLLLAEDNPVNVMVARKYLAKWNITPDHAPDGRAALTRVQEKTYDVVLMDLQMPGMDGLEATLAIRRLGGRYTALPIIALTADISVEVKAQSLAVGMNDFLTKPYRPADLFRVLTRFVRPTADPLPVAPISAGPVDTRYAFPKIDELAEGDEAFTRQMKASCVVELEECSLNLRESLLERDEARFRATLHKAKPLFNLLDLTELETALMAVRTTIHGSADEAERDRLVREIEAVCGATERRLRESLLMAETVR